MKINAGWRCQQGLRWWSRVSSCCRWSSAVPSTWSLSTISPEVNKIGGVSGVSCDVSLFSLLIFPGVACDVSQTNITWSLLMYFSYFLLFARFACFCLFVHFCTFVFVFSCIWLLHSFSSFFRCTFYCRVIQHPTPTQMFIDIFHIKIHSASHKSTNVFHNYHFLPPGFSSRLTSVGAAKEHLLWIKSRIERKKTID